MLVLLALSVLLLVHYLFFYYTKTLTYNRTNMMDRPLLWAIILMAGALILWANNSEMDLYNTQGHFMHDGLRPHHLQEGQWAQRAGYNWTQSKEGFFSKQAISAALWSHVQYWNAQPEGVRYHVADAMSPWSKSCRCYARWLNGTDEMCEEAVYQGKPQVRLAIPNGWFNDYLCTQGHKQGSLDCPASSCHFTLISSQTNYSQFDGLLHYSGAGKPSVPGMPERSPWFKSGLIWEEPAFDYSTSAHYIDRGYDVAFTYHLPLDMPESAFFQTSLLTLPLEFFKDFHPPTWTGRTLNVASIISHCVSERGRVIEALSQFIEIDRFGTCDGGRKEELLPQCQDGSWEVRQRCLIGHYRFYLAFENSQSESYVTEKLWQPLLMGAIPIYWGAPNVNDYLPHPDAIIRVSDFESIKALADYLNLLTTSDTAYKKHMQWRNDPLPQSFLDLFGTSPGHAPCHLCDLIAREKIQRGISV